MSILLIWRIEFHYSNHVLACNSHTCATVKFKLSCAIYAYMYRVLNLCMCIYVCMYACMYAYMYFNMYMYVYRYMYVYMTSFIIIGPNF